MLPEIDGTRFALTGLTSAAGEHPDRVRISLGFGASTLHRKRVNMFYSEVERDAAEVRGEEEEEPVFLLMAAALYGPVCYAGIASPGHSYSMSSSYWVNTGTEPETLVFRVGPPAAASWIKIEESSITLDPGQAASIPVMLTVPVGAAKGIYRATLEASGAEESVEFGVGVSPGCTGPAAPPLAPGGGRGFPLPLWLVAGLLLAAALLTWLARQRRTDCDHPVHGQRGGKWQSLNTPGHASGCGQTRSRPRGSCR